MAAPHCRGTAHNNKGRPFRGGPYYLCAILRGSERDAARQAMHSACRSEARHFDYDTKSTAGAWIQLNSMVPKGAAFDSLAPETAAGDESLFMSASICSAFIPPASR